MGVWAGQEDSAEGLEKPIQEHRIKTRRAFSLTMPRKAWERRQRLRRTGTERGRDREEVGTEAEMR